MTIESRSQSSQPRFSANPRHNRWLLLVIAVALFTRGLAAWHWQADAAADPDGYRALAESLAVGDGFVGTEGEPTAFRPPGYPLLLAGASVLSFGTDPLLPLQVGLGILTVLLTAAAGKRLALGNARWLAAGLVAVDPLLLRYTPQVMTEVTCAAISAALLWGFAAPTISGKNPLPAQSRGKVAGWGDWALGALCAVAVLMRPTYWVFLALLGVWRGVALCFARRQKLMNSRFSAGRLGWWALGFALPVAVWTLRNFVQLGAPVVMTTHGGYTLLLANNPVFYREVVADPAGRPWQGDSLRRWQANLEKAMARDGVPHNELARDRWHADRAKPFIAAHPAAFFRATVYRLGRFWDVLPTGSASLLPPIRIAVATFYVGMQGLALIGLLRLVRSHALEWMPVAVLVLAFTAVHAVYWTDTRMRAPVVPAVALLAVAALKPRTEAPNIAGAKLFSSAKSA